MDIFISISFLLENLMLIVLSYKLAQGIQLEIT